MAEPNTRDYVQERYERSLRRNGPDAASTKMWKERLRSIDSGAANKSPSQVFFSGHGRPVD